MRTSPPTRVLLLAAAILLTARIARAEKLPGVAGVEMTASRVEMSHNGEVITATGSACATKDETRIQADRVYVWAKRGQLYAEGNVIWMESGVLSQSERLVYDWEDRRGIAFNTELHSLRTAPLGWHFTFPEIQEQGEGSFLTEKARGTTCEFASPCQHFSARRVRFRQDHSVVFHHAVFHVHDLPVFYFPYYYRDLKYDWPWYRFGVGRSSEFGVFTRNDIGFSISPGVDLLFDLDYYEKRGPAAGVNLEYETDWQIGYIDTYYVQDDGEDIQGTPLEETERYRLKLVHRELLTDTEVDDLLDARHFWQAGRWAVDVEYHHYSDAGFLREFFEDEYEAGKEPENRVYLQGNWDNTAVRGLVQPKVNEFFNLPQSLQRDPDGTPGQTEYLPSASLDLLSQPLWRNHLFLTVNSEAARLDREVPDAARDDMAPPIPGREVQRLDLQTELSAPFRLQALHIEPFLFDRETYYSDTLGEDEDPVRTAYGAGARVSTEFWRTYPATSSWWDIHDLHHVITPEIRFLSVQRPNIEPEDLTFYDATDTVRALESVNLNLRNVLQTRRSGGTVNWIEFEIESNYYPSPRRDNGGDEWGNILTDLRWRVHPRLYLFNDTEIHPDPLSLEVINGGFTVTPARAVSVSASQRYTRDETNQTILTADAQLSEKWSVAVRHDFEWHAGKIVDMRIVAIRDFHCWYLQISYDIGRSEDGMDSTFSFFIGPRGLPVKSNLTAGGRRVGNFIPDYR